MVNLDVQLKLKQNPSEETWREWIEAHAENEIRKGNYVGRAWYLLKFNDYFSGKTLDEKDREIADITANLGYKLVPCRDFKKDGEKCSCEKYHKELGNPPRKTAKCKNKHDYFSAVNACHKIE